MLHAPNNYILFQKQTGLIHQPMSHLLHTMITKSQPWEKELLLWAMAKNSHSKIEMDSQLPVSILKKELLITMFRKIEDTVLTMIPKKRSSIKGKLAKFLVLASIITNQTVKILSE